MRRGRSGKTSDKETSCEISGDAPTSKRTKMGGGREREILSVTTQEAKTGHVRGSAVSRRETPP